MDELGLASLNERQREAVTAPMGNVLVLAGAGSGKTRVLVSRVAYLVSEHALSPYAILAVTFTNKAAGEMKARLRGMLPGGSEGLMVGTFHGLCHRLLRQHHEAAGLPEQFQILDSDDQLRLIKRVMSNLNLEVDQWPPKQAQAFINGRKDEGLRPQHVKVPSYGPGRTWLSVYDAYEKACRTAGVIDFAELLLRCHELLRDNAELLAHYQNRFRVILVDEFQDTNTVQYAWIRLLSGASSSVMAVGDDDQSIYGWRGAKVENIQRFSDDFSNVNVVRLEQNYRSTGIILSAANALITHNTTRLGKNLWTESDDGEKITVYGALNELDEARFVTERIEIAINEGCSPDDIAVLYRSNAQSRVLEEALLRAGIEYHIHGGVRFFVRAEIKDTLSYLRLMTNIEDDVAFERVVNFPTRGIGEKTLETIRAEAREKNTSLWQTAVKQLAEGIFPARAGNALTGFLQLIERMQTELLDARLEAQVEGVLEASGVRAHFMKMKGERAEAKRENLEELIHAAKQFEEEQAAETAIETLSDFLAHASLEGGEQQADKDVPHVHLMTLHAAKGLEFPNVFLVGMEEGLFPGRQSADDEARLEEERRLCYVGMTRAMDKLVISHADIRRQHGREEYHKPSRFLKELPKNLLDEIRVTRQTNTQAYSPMRSPASTAPVYQEEVPGGFRLGQVVKHAKFGAGVVLALEGSGAHTRLQVNFETHGSKWLVAAYANLA